MEFNQISLLKLDLKENIIHIYSKKSKDFNSIKTYITFLIATTSPLVLKILNEEINENVILYPKTIYSSSLCTAGEIIFEHKEKFLIQIFDHNENNVLSFDSIGNQINNSGNIKTVFSKKRLRKFSYKKPNNNDGISFKEIRNKFLMKIKYILFTLKLLLKVFIKLIFNLLKYIFTSRLR